MSHFTIINGFIITRALTHLVKWVQPVLLTHVTCCGYFYNQLTSQSIIEPSFISLLKQLIL